MCRYTGLAAGQSAAGALGCCRTGVAAVPMLIPSANGFTSSWDARMSCADADQVSSHRQCRPRVAALAAPALSRARRGWAVVSHRQSTSSPPSNEVALAMRVFFVTVSPSRRPPSSVGGQVLVMLFEPPAAAARLRGARRRGVGKDGETGAAQARRKGSRGSGAVVAAAASRWSVVLLLQCSMEARREERDRLGRTSRRVVEVVLALVARSRAVGQLRLDEIRLKSARPPARRDTRPAGHASPCALRGSRARSRCGERRGSLPPAVAWCSASTRPLARFERPTATPARSGAGPNDGDDDDQPDGPTVPSRPPPELSRR